MINMKISDQGLELIMQFEGCRLGAYHDAVGVPTIGYGHTQGVKMGDHITHREAEMFLKEDINSFEKCVNSLFADVELTQGKFDALVSFAFNLGCGALRKSTLRRKLIHNDIYGAADEFPKWCHAGHRKLKGLVRRRAAERELFLS
jgi:GH24 family phage-related lysozyme (muramidase)